MRTLWLEMSMHESGTINVDVLDRLVHHPGGEVVVRDYLPARLVHATPLLWLHGRAFVEAGLHDAESATVARSIASSGRWVRAVDYRLMPARGLLTRDPKRQVNRFPAALDDVVAAAEDLTLAARAPLFIGGASAGASLAASAVAWLSVCRTLPVLGAILAYGVYHSSLPEPDGAIRVSARFTMARSIMRRVSQYYVGDSSVVVRGQAFAGESDLRNFPPSLVIDAERDVLRVSGAAFQHALRSSAVPTSYLVVRGSRHGFLKRPSSEPARTTLPAIHHWARSIELAAG